MKNGRPIGRESDRAQTLPDFVIGVTVFLLTIGFIVAFVPQMMAPYEGQETSVVADRAASSLANDLLSKSGAASGQGASSEQEPSSGLNETCTAAFFTDSDASGCSFDANDSIEDRIGIDSRYAINVTLEGSVGGSPGSDTWCADEDEESIGPCDGDQTERLAVGPSTPDDSRSVATARQVVHVNGSDAVLEVSIWS